MILLKTLLLIAVICGLWLWVQRSWLDSLPEHERKDDALAGRSGCAACTCDNTRCERN